MLNTLSQVQDAKIQVEAHTTRLAYENPAKNKWGSREGEIE